MQHVKDVIAGPKMKRAMERCAPICARCNGTGWKHSEREMKPPVTGKRDALKYSFVEECECRK